GTTAVWACEYSREVQDDDVIKRSEAGSVAGFHIPIMADVAGTSRCGADDAVIYRTSPRVAS
ncbi:MAG: hypothetical protein EBY61_06270, partial [Actinobacteria bacterium]|nr:hypothetical protein [Actinomycetota bacterium]